jgi:hypothetical protein
MATHSLLLSFSKIKDQFDALFLSLLSDTQFCSWVETKDAQYLIEFLCSCRQKLSDEQFRFVVSKLGKMNPWLLLWFLDNHFSQLTDEQFSIVGHEVDKANLLEEFLHTHLCELSLEQFNQVLSLYRVKNELPKSPKNGELKFLNIYFSKLTDQQFDTVIKSQGDCNNTKFLGENLTKLTNHQVATVLAEIWDKKWLFTEYGTELTKLTETQLSTALGKVETPIIKDFLNKHFTQLTENQLYVVLCERYSLEEVLASNFTKLTGNQISTLFAKMDEWRVNSFWKSHYSKLTNERFYCVAIHLSSDDLKCFCSPDNVECFCSLRDLECFCKSQFVKLTSEQRGFIVKAAYKVGSQHHVSVQSILGEYFDNPPKTLRHQCLELLLQHPIYAGDVQQLYDDFMAKNYYSGKKG